MIPPTFDLLMVKVPFSLLVVQEYINSVEGFNKLAIHTSVTDQYVLQNENILLKEQKTGYKTPLIFRCKID